MTELLIDISNALVFSELPSEKVEVSEDLYEDLYEVETEPATVSVRTVPGPLHTDLSSAPTFSPSSRSRSPSGFYRGGSSGPRASLGLYLTVSVLCYLHTSY